jgi:hypothetical protein
MFQMLLKDGDSAVKASRIFGKHFNTTRDGNVPCRSAVQFWVETFRTQQETTRQCGYSAIATQH